MEDRGRTRTVRLAGRLGQEQSAELVRLYNEAPGVVRLDLSDLLSADAAGLETLALLARRGADLVGTSPYLTLQLQMAEAAHARHRQDVRPGSSMDPEASTEGRRHEREDE